MKVYQDSCENCLHRNVCALKANYLKITGKAYEISNIEKLDNEDNFSLNVKCNHYNKEKSWSEKLL